jgi:putative oxidoreductase
LLTALFFHAGADQAIQLQKNVAMAGGFLALVMLGPGAWRARAL